MRSIRIYRNPDCAKCARYARMHERLDWRGRVEISTRVPPGGPLAMGEVVVERLKSGEMLYGAEAFAEICRHIPVYMLLRPLLLVPVVRRAVEREMLGCDDGACGLPHGRHR